MRGAARPRAGRSATRALAGLRGPGGERGLLGSLGARNWDAPLGDAALTKAHSALQPPPTLHGSTRPCARDRRPRARRSPPPLTAARAPTGALAVATPTQPGAASTVPASGRRLQLGSGRHEVRPHAARRAVGAVGGRVHPVQGAQEDPQGVHQRRRLLSRCRGRFHDEAAQCGRLGRHLLREPGA